MFIILPSEIVSNSNALLFSIIASVKMNVGATAGEPMLAADILNVFPAA